MTSSDTRSRTTRHRTRASSRRRRCGWRRSDRSRSRDRTCPGSQSPRAEQIGRMPCDLSPLTGAVSSRQMPRIELSVAGNQRVHNRRIVGAHGESNPPDVGRRESRSHRRSTYRRPSTNAPVRSNLRRIERRHTTRPRGDDARDPAGGTCLARPMEAAHRVGLAAIHAEERPGDDPIRIAGIDDDGVHGGAGELRDCRSRRVRSPSWRRRRRTRRDRRRGRSPRCRHRCRRRCDPDWPDRSQSIRTPANPS